MTNTSSRRSKVPSKALGRPGKKRSHAAAKAGVARLATKAVPGKTKMKLVAKKGAARPVVPSPLVAQEIIASRQVGRVEALRYALTHPARSKEEQARLLRETLRNVAPDDARLIQKALKAELDSRRRNGHAQPDPDLELTKDPRPGAYP